MNQTYKLQSLLTFMSIQDPAGDWEELDPADATKKDLMFLFDTLNYWVTEGLEATPKVQEYLDYLKEEIQ